ncbi:major facilitator superfamily domain-containing protein [Morchella snyderi]|nr:major facilitator superfamily domain-containing protein [Morchella snyderi]
MSSIQLRNYRSEDLELSRSRDISQTEEREDAGSGTYSLTASPPTRKKQALVLLSTFFMFFQTIGINQSYGIFQEYYTTPSTTPLPLSQAKNLAAVAFVGTMGAGLTWGGSIFINPIVARVRDVRWVTVTGSVMMSVGLVAAGEARSLWQLYLTQSLCYGLGSSMLYFPMVSMAPEYFDKHRGAAMGFILSGAGCGGLVLSPITRLLLDTVGLRWALRLLGLLTLAVTLPISFSASWRFGRPQGRTRVNVSLARKPTFILQSLAALLQASGNFVPLTFLTTFSTTLGYSSAFAAILLALNNGVNTVSRILLGALADVVGRQNMIVIGMLGSAGCVWGLWLTAAASGGKAVWIAFVIGYGMMAGGYNALLPTVIAEIYGIQAYSSVNGFVYFVRGIGAFFGSPVGGAILDSSSSSGKPGEYMNVIIYDGALLLGASLCVMGVRFFDAAEKGRWKLKA